MSSEPQHILFVCLGNICRSPAAEGIARAALAQRGLEQAYDIDSCGTAAFNTGKAPDPRMIDAMAGRGYDISGLRARQICDADFERNGHIIAMDRKNLLHVQTWAPPDFSGTIRLLLDYTPGAGQRQVPDPYYADAASFPALVQELETACGHLLDQLQHH